MAQATALIGGDWGGSHLRLYRFAPDGTVLGRRSAPLGVNAMSSGGWEAALADLAGGWLGHAPIVLCGAVGSNLGWRPTPYIACPADLDDLPRRLTAVDCALGAVWLASGLRCDHADGRADILRGEETQVLGALAVGRSLPRWVIAPGTHGKWIELDARSVRGFTTFMTGELFDVLRRHSVLGRSMVGDAHDAAAFARGVGRALADPAITSLMFSARADAVAGRLAAEATASYLSGLLIGAEIAAAPDRKGPVTIVGSPGLVALYCEALTLAGFGEVSLVDGDEAVEAGLWRLAEPRLRAEASP